MADAEKRQTRRLAGLATVSPAKWRHARQFGIQFPRCQPGQLQGFACLKVLHFQNAGQSAITHQSVEPVCHEAASHQDVPLTKRHSDQEPNPGLNDRVPGPHEVIAQMAPLTAGVGRPLPLAGRD